jgi:hypothetical protein
VLVDFAFLKQRYDYELELKEKLTNAVSQSAGFLTLAGGLLAVMARGFSYEQTWLTGGFIAALIVAAGVGTFCARQLALAYRQTGYWHLPTLGDLVKAQHNVFTRRLLNGMSEAQARAEFTALLEMYVVQASDRNAAGNERRARALVRANDALMFMIAVTAIAGVSYVVDQTVRSFMPKNRIVLTDPPEIPKTPPEINPVGLVEVQHGRWPSRFPPGYRLELDLPWWYRLFDWEPLPPYNPPLTKEEWDSWARYSSGAGVDSVDE